MLDLFINVELKILIEALLFYIFLLKMSALSIFWNEEYRLDKTFAIIFCY